MGGQPAEHNQDDLKRTPLHALHVELGAKMVPFAGYEMSVNYPLGILKEHLHTRAAAGLFDVSHMGQAFIVGSDHAASAGALEALMPAALREFQPGAMRYSFLLNEEGGVIDDLIVSRSHAAHDDGMLMLVVNADRKALDYRHLETRLPDGVELRRADERALLALQGPAAAAVLARHAPMADALDFMTTTRAEFDGIDCNISRSGYTGEDGFEISVSAERADELARALLAGDEVEPIGLGARDSLRLEAGLCLYGHDLDETISPIEAGLVWAIGKRRRVEGGFPGAGRIQREIENGAERRRVGISFEGRAPAREGSEIIDTDGKTIGRVTSGGFAPSLGCPIAMGYVERTSSKVGTAIEVMVRGKALPAAVAKLPFVPHRYHRA